MVGVGMRHSTPLISLFEDEDEVNMVEDSKPTTSEWLVDSGASVHVTNSKDDRKSKIMVSTWQNQKLQHNNVAEPEVTEHCVQSCFCR